MKLMELLPDGKIKVIVHGGNGVEMVFSTQFVIGSVTQESGYIL